MKGKAAINALILAKMIRAAMLFIPIIDAFWNAIPQLVKSLLSLEERPIVEDTCASVAAQVSSCPPTGKLVSNVPRLALQVIIAAHRAIR